MTKKEHCMLTSAHNLPITRYIDPALSFLLTLIGTIIHKLNILLYLMRHENTKTTHTHQKSVKCDHRVEEIRLLIVIRVVTYFWLLQNI